MKCVGLIAVKQNIAFARAQRVRAMRLDDSVLARKASTRTLFLNRNHAESRINAGFRAIRELLPFRFSCASSHAERRSRSDAERASFFAEAFRFLVDNVLTA